MLLPRPLSLATELEDIRGWRPAAMPPWAPDALGGLPESAAPVPGPAGPAAEGLLRARLDLRQLQALHRSQIGALEAARAELWGSLHSGRRQQQLPWQLRDGQAIVPRASEEH